MRRKHTKRDADASRRRDLAEQVERARQKIARQERELEDARQSIDVLEARLAGYQRESDQIHATGVHQQETCRKLAELVLELVTPAEVEQLAQEARRRHLKDLGIEDAAEAALTMPATELLTNTDGQEWPPDPFGFGRLRP